MQHALASTTTADPAHASVVPVYPHDALRTTAIDPKHDTPSTGTDAVHLTSGEKANNHALSKLSREPTSLHEEAVLHALHVSDGPESPKTEQTLKSAKGIGIESSPDRRIESFLEMSNNRGPPKGRPSKEGSDSGTGTNKPPQKRGRPKGSISLQPNKKRAPKQFPEMPPSDNEALDRAKGRISQSVRHRDDALGALAAAEALFESAREKLETCRREARRADEAVERAAADHAEDMLVEPTCWNSVYRGLRGWHGRHGHIVFPLRGVPESVGRTHGLAAMAPGEREEWIKKYRTFSRFLTVQRRLRRKNQLEPYRVALLNQLDIEWNPKIAPGPERWARKYDLLKSYAQEFGNCNVPKSHDSSLCNFTKTCSVQYNQRRRIGFEKELPRDNRLTDERIRLLEGIGMEWPEPPNKIPWEDQYRALCAYNEEFGHAHVKWRDPGRLLLADWVGRQRKRYRNPEKYGQLTAEQTEKLERINFAWNAGDTLRYKRDAVQDTEDAESNENGGEVFRSG